MAEAPEICCHRLGCTFETTWIQTTSGHTSWSEKSAVQNGNHLTPRIVRELKNVPTKSVEVFIMRMGVSVIIFGTWQF